MIPRLARPFGLEHSPVGLWNFYENLNDSSGNGFNLTVQAGTANYVSALPGLGGVLLDGSTCLYHNVASTALAITGNMTLLAIVSLDVNAAGDARFVSYSTALGGTSDTNTLYSLGLATANRWSYRYLHHAGSNSSNAYNPTAWGTDQHNVVLVGFTRSANVIQPMRNAGVFGAASSALSAPTGGLNSRLRIGAATDAGGRIVGVVGGVKIVPSALTADQWKAEYNRTLGPVLGYAA